MIFYFILFQKNIKFLKFFFFKKKYRYLSNYTKNFFILKNFNYLLKSSLYFILNKKKKQIYFNLLSNKKKNKLFFSTGTCLAMSSIKNKSLKRSLRGFTIFLSFLKKNILKNSNFFYIFYFNSSKKISFFLFKEIFLFLKKLKKNNNLFIWQIKSPTTIFKNIRRIKRRLRKRIQKHERGTFFN